MTLNLGGAQRAVEKLMESEVIIQHPGREVLNPVDGTVSQTMTTVYDASNPLLHDTVRLQAIDAAGRSMAVEGQVLTICPTKIPRPAGVTFVNEGLARFTAEGRTGFGIAEHWHAVAR